MESTVSRKLQFQSKQTSEIPIDVDGVLPERTFDKDLKTIQQLRIHLGNREIELGELFDVTSTGNLGDDEHIWIGKLDNVHRIGQAMSRGEIAIFGDAGRHTGSQMTGGTLTVNGSAGDFAGAEMVGGQLFVGKDVGDWAGAGYPGALIGMNRGTLLIGGNAGMGLGYAMRRGVIAVQGNCQGQIGWRMRGGTILVRGSVEPEIGTNLVRGTIILGNTCERIGATSQAGANSHSDSDIDDVSLKLGPTYRQGGCGEFVVCRLLQRYIESLEKPFSMDLDFLSQRFQTFHGDQLELGRGEIFAAVH